MIRIRFENSLIAAERPIVLRAIFVQHAQVQERADMCGIANDRTLVQFNRRIVIAVVVSLALTAAAVPAVVALVSWALPAPDHRYNARIVCGKEGTPSRNCRLQDLPRAEFVDHFERELAKDEKGPARTGHRRP